MLAGDVDTGKAILRDYIKATVGFEKLGEATGTPAKSLIRMFGPRGNPQARNLFGVIGYLQKAGRRRAARDAGAWLRRAREQVQSSDISSVNAFIGMCSAASKNSDPVLISLTLAPRATTSLAAYAAFSFTTKNANLL